MPKELIGMSARVARAERRMSAVVMGSSHPERALKNEVFRLCDTMTSKEVGAVLGQVYVKLGAREHTAFMADYMKDLYGSGKRRLFVPKPQARAVGVRVKPIGLKQVMVESVKLALTDGSVEEVPLVDVGTATSSIAGKPGKRKDLKKRLERAKTVAVPNVKNWRTHEAAASVDTGSASPSGSSSDDVVTLKTVANYCMKTASRYSEARPVYDMLMELYSRNPTPEWLAIKDEIKAHVDKLPGNSYITVYGTHVEQQHIQNNVEKVEDGGEVVMEQKVSAAVKRDGRKRKGHSERLVKAVYMYSHMKDKFAHKRLDLFYRSLINMGWLDKETLPDTFVALFSGVTKEFTMKWVGTQSDLYALVKHLFDKGHISCGKGGSKWQIAGSHFVDSRSCYYTDWNKQKERKQSMPVIRNYMLLLDPSVMPTGELLKDLKVDEHKV